MARSGALSMLRRVCAGSLAVLTGLALAGGAAAQLPDPERGRLLYENHCSECHTPRVHRRVPSKAIDRAALRFIVRVWSEERNLRWTEREIEDVTHYLETVHYRDRLSPGPVGAK